ncbi:MAG: phenylacetate-CoA oxygenase subunit PaaI [Myxococcota bacterium]|jgi:ring-1,2-phenylacetyl-CoA epoxidase subunit PaaA|nr:phenylacetate-CoA oxygenase subunit PaaI [Myxococcota bacterium]
MTSEYHEVKTVADLASEPAEYREAITKIVISHTVNELYGAQVFDEPAIALAPTPYAKWLTCRIAMEEYHHHVRFKALADDLQVPPEATDPKQKRPLSIFGFPMKSWPEFCVIKMLADLAEILQVEDLLHCSFVPLRNIGRVTMPEEKFHAAFGKDFCTELCKTEEGRAAVQRAIDDYAPYLPKFFGAAGSKNNETYRKYALKARRNEQMREDFLSRARSVVESLGLRFPEIAEA